MRKIKFRAKDEVNGVWVYGNYLYDDEKDKHIIRPIISASIYCNPDTLGQYTGLNDCNNREIYEGDIVKTTYKEVRDYMGVKYDNEMQFIEKVIWSDDYNGWCLELTNCKLKMYRRFNYCEEVNHIKLLKVEVVGNVYDNPELLEEM